MKRYVILFLVITTLCNTGMLFAQKGSIYAGITGGLAMPVGNFAQSDYSNDKAGFAASGFNIGATGVYFLNKNWGIGALVSYNKFGFKGTQKLSDGYKEDFAVDSVTVYVKGDNHTINMMVGPYYSIPVKKLAIDFRVLVGLVSASLAGNEVYLEDNPATTFSQKSATATTFGMQAGAGVRYSFTKRIAVALNLDYFYSKPDFSVENVNRVNEAGRKITTYNEPIMGLNTNLSLIYQLKH